MTLNMVKFTDDRNEMIKIGQDIVSNNPQKYTLKTMSMIEKYVRDRMPEASEQELLDTMLLTVYHYWAYGSTYDEYFYYDFVNKTHAEKLTYMTFRVRLIYMEHMNKKENAHLLFNKFETYQLFKQYYMRDVILCSAEKDYPAFREFVSKHTEFVVKPTDMSGGRGVYKTSVIGMNEGAIKELFYKLLREGAENRDKYQRGTENSVVLEELIEQDESLAVFNPESVNGVRVPTVTVGGKTVIYQPWLKIGRGGNFLTSAVFGTLDAGINSETGIVDTPGMNETGEVWEKHPDNGLPIIGFQIPKWNDLMKLAKECAAKLPDFGYVGWDFVLSKRGWCIMEANYSGDFMWQLYRNKGMKKEFEELIGWRLTKEFWWQD